MGLGYKIFFIFAAFMAVYVELANVLNFGTIGVGVGLFFLLLILNEIRQLKR